MVDAILDLEVIMNEPLRLDGLRLIPGGNERVEISVIGKDVIGLSSDCAVNKFVVVRVSRDNPEPELRVKKENVGVKLKQRCQEPLHLLLAPRI